MKKPCAPQPWWHYLLVMPKGKATHQRPICPRSFRPRTTVGPPTHLEQAPEWLAGDRDEFATRQFGRRNRR